MLSLFNRVDLRDDDTGSCVESKSNGGMIMSGYSFLDLAYSSVFGGDGYLPDPGNALALTHERDLVNQLQHVSTV